MEDSPTPPSPPPTSPAEESDEREPPFARILRDATPAAWVTPTLLVVNLVYFAWLALRGVSVVAPNGFEFLPYGANYGPLVFEGEWWRTLSSTFLHSGILHLGLNMWGLWILGGLAERLFGNTVFLIMYLMSGVGGSLASLVWHPERVSVGASGAIFGLAGALVAFFFLANVPLPPNARRRPIAILLFVIGFNLLFGATWPGIDNAAHLGGLLTGLVIGGSLHRPLPARPRSWKQYLVLPAVALGFAALAAQALSGVEDNPRLVLSRALQLSFEGKREAAIAMLEEEVADPPAIPEVHALLGGLYQEDGRTDEAIAQFERAVESSPGSPVLVSNLGLAQLVARRYEEAVPPLRRAVALEPDNSEHHNRLALALAAAGEVEEALGVIEKALDLEPDAPHILDSLGTVRYFRGEMEAAIDAYRSAIAGEPDFAVYRYNLSLALDKAGRLEAAREARRRAFELDPDLELPPDGFPIM